MTTDGQKEVLEREVEYLTLRHMVEATNTVMQEDGTFDFEQQEFALMATAFGGTWDLYENMRLYELTKYSDAIWEERADTDHSEFMEQGAHVYLKYPPPRIDSPVLMRYPTGRDKLDTGKTSRLEINIATIARNIRIPYETMMGLRIGDWTLLVTTFWDLAGGEQETGKSLIL